ncbi:hypothetical protein DFH06DRAFT_1468541 [Mycena polygramma]|nr:hypothetical protein DFH06DRAFT_1468541 [Mycena polygramma]
MGTRYQRRIFPPKSASAVPRFCMLRLKSAKKKTMHLLSALLLCAAGTLASKQPHLPAAPRTHNNLALRMETVEKRDTYTGAAMTWHPTDTGLDACRGKTLKGGDWYLDESIATLPEILRDAGYETLMQMTFWVTNYFDASKFPAKAPSEIQQGKNLVDSALEAGVNFFVFSGLPSISRLTGGKFTRARHFDNKEVIQEYLQASGLANATIHLGGFLENFWTMRLLKKTPTGFDIGVPMFKRESPYNRDLGAAIALLKSYNDPDKGVSGNVYPVISACLTYPALAELVSKALGAEVTFTTKEALGVEELDEMFEAQSEFASDFMKGVTVPNSDLVALGGKFSSIEEFMETEIKTRFRAAGRA